MEATGVTHEVIQSDIEFARRLMEAGCQNGEIVAHLRGRGVHDSSALELVLNLRHLGFVKIQQPISDRSLGRKHRARIKRKRSRRHHRREGKPSFLYREERRKRGHALRVAMRLTGGALVLVVALLSFGYAGYCTWLTARSRQERMSPAWRERMGRWEAGLPDTVSDNLKTLPCDK